jgi:hypothetical protein
VPGGRDTTVLIDGAELDHPLLTIRGDLRTVGPFLRLARRPTNAGGTLPGCPPHDRHSTGRV